VNFNIGDKVEFKRKEYRVLGFAAATDGAGHRLIEIAWNDFELSHTGYFAVSAIHLIKM